MAVKGRSGIPKVRSGAGSCVQVSVMFPLLRALVVLVAGLRSAGNRPCCFPAVAVLHHVHGNRCAFDVQRIVRTRQVCFKSTPTPLQLRDTPPKLYTDTTPAQAVPERAMYLQLQAARCIAVRHLHLCWWQCNLIVQPAVAVKDIDLALQP